jgi:hypothetical protein
MRIFAVGVPDDENHRQVVTHANPHKHWVSQLQKTYKPDTLTPI